MKGRPAVFLDRDGVINRQRLVNGKVDMLRSVGDFEWLPGSLDALKRLRAAGLPLFVITNQPDIARGRLPLETHEKIHAKMTAEFQFEAVYTCPHDDSDACDCRKPAPGLIHRAAKEHNVDPAQSFLVGDRGRDIEAGRRAGCRTILIRHPYTDSVTADFEAGNLMEAADIILRLMGEHGS